MFTGLVQGCGVVRELIRTGDIARLVIDPGSWSPDGRALADGDSVCVSGVCLTVVQLEGADRERVIGFDVIQETFNRTTLGQLTPGTRVNLESSVTPTTPLGGHFMQGHVDGAGVVTGVCEDPTDRRITIQPKPMWIEWTEDSDKFTAMDVIVPKGTIAIDGVSLTVSGVSNDTFEVALIPATLELTTLGKLVVGDEVNLEIDILSKTVAHMLARRGML